MIKDTLDKYRERVEPPKAMNNMNVFKRRLERAIEQGEPPQVPKIT